MQCTDLIPVTALLGCSEPDLLPNSLGGGCGPEREGVGCRDAHPWASPGSWRAPAAEMESSGPSLL